MALRITNLGKYILCKYENAQLFGQAAFLTSFRKTLQSYGYSNQTLDMMMTNEFYAEIIHYAFSAQRYINRVASKPAPRVVNLSQMPRAWNTSLVIKALLMCRNCKLGIIEE